MLIVSKYSGVCLTCQREVRVGDRVSWLKGRKGVEHAACSQEGRDVAAKVEASKATDVPAIVNLPVPDGLSYLGYQRAGIVYALAHEGTIIADEMGLGKTVQAIGVINASPDVQRVLIVCPASLKLNWRNECRKWLTREARLLIWNGKVTTVGDGKLSVEIINCDILKKLPASSMWDLLVLDESHYIKNPKAQRTKAVRELRARSKRVLALTGTPILNRPIELWPVLQIVAPETWDPPGYVKGRAVDAGEGAGFFRFAKRYCNARQVWHGRSSHWDFTGASNLDELQERLRGSCMVRRLKADVLKELPAKRRQTIELEIEGCQAELDAENDSWGDTDFVSVKARARVQFTEISSARAALALKKVPAVVEHVTDAFESSGKIILFAHHREVIAQLAEGLAQFNPVVITGETPVASRQAAVEAFQNDPSCRLIIGSIGAMGVGLTLTASSHVIFAELDWTPANVTQAEDRAHRIGQLESVLVQHLVVKGSLDARMVELLIQKQEIADLALDEETLDDVSDRPMAVRPENISDAALVEALKVSGLVHMQLRYLAACCDGAQARDGSGFNKLDAPIGKRLASLSGLTPRQALLGQKIVTKYRRQLEGLSL
jgi:SWI/SNF-related matrix-associated actin-dependent regulator 1 of chromatin subfamily A